MGLHITLDYSTLNIGIIIEQYIEQTQWCIICNGDHYHYFLMYRIIYIVNGIKLPLNWLECEYAKLCVKSIKLSQNLHYHIQRVVPGLLRDSSFGLSQKDEWAKRICIGNPGFKRTGPINNPMLDPKFSQSLTWQKEVKEFHPTLKTGCDIGRGNELLLPSFL